MKALTLVEMETASNGGSRLTDVVDVVCGLWGVGRAIKILAFANPVTAIVAETVDVGCAVYGVGRAFGVI